MSFLHSSHEFLLLGRSLESTVSELAGSIDELQVDLLEGGPARLVNERFSQRQNSSLHSDGGSLHHDKVLSHVTESNETSHRVDVLFSEIKLCGTGFLSGPSDSVDLLVDFGSVMESVLTSSWH